MKVQSQLPSLMEDNNYAFLRFIFTAVEHSDFYADIIINKNANGELSFAITPSSKEFKQDIINDLLYAKNHMKIKIIFSKSLERQENIHFTIQI